MENALLIHPDDDVVVVTKQIKKGDTVKYGKEQSVMAVENIPVYHKIAVHEIKKGEAVHKYNNIIGQAMEDIHVGQYVHVHNIHSMVKKEEV